MERKESIPKSLLATLVVEIIAPQRQKQWTEEAMEVVMNSTKSEEL